MNHLDQFKRSVNIWKVSDMDKEAINIYVDMYLWMEDMFKDLNIYTSDKYPLSTFYGTSKDNIILEQDLKNDWNSIHYDKVYSVFKSKYKSYISDYDYIMDILQEYLGNTLHLKGSHTEPMHSDMLAVLGNTLHLKGSHTFGGRGEWIRPWEYLTFERKSHH